MIVAVAHLMTFIATASGSSTFAGMGPLYLYVHGVHAVLALQAARVYHNRGWETAHSIAVVALSISMAPPWYLIPGDVDVRLGPGHITAPPAVVLIFAIAVVGASLWVARATLSSRRPPALWHTALFSLFGVSALMTLVPIGTNVTDGPTYEPYVRVGAAVLVLAAGWVGSGRAAGERKYARSGLSRGEAERILKALEQLMDEDRPYLDPQLTLPALAERLDTGTNVLSQAINQTTNAGLRGYITSRRIDHFKRRAGEGDLTHMTILALAHECGFRSKSAFNEAFKRFEGKTPREFLRSLEQKGPPR